jgi:acetylornithine/succinyldiaminopimelate/putrescine aminotransferase
MIHTDSALSPLCEMYSYSRPYEVLAAKNATLRLRAPDEKIYSFTDLMCAYGAVNFGHMNPSIDPFSSLSSDLVACFYPPNATSYATWLLNKLKLTGHTVLYQVGGSFAVSSAMAIAQRIRPGKILTIQGSFHGLGVDTLAASSRGRNASVQESPLVTEMDKSILRIPAGSEFSDWDQVSCLLYEPIQGANGYVPLPLAWLRALSQSAQAAGVTVIADEIQCGFFRFGFLSTAQQENLNPDIYLFSKSMTNGIYPLSVVIYPHAFHSVLPTGDDYWNHTFQTASLGLDAAEAVAAYIDSTDISGKIAEVHAALARSVERLAGNPDLSAFHLAGPTLSLGVRDGRASEVVRKCEDRGVLIFGGGGGQRIRIAPPITIPVDQLVSALAIIEESVNSL